MRRVVGLFALAFVGCGGGGTPTQPEPPAPVTSTSAPLPQAINHGLAIRGGKGDAPAPAPTPPKPGTMLLPEGGGTWPWDLPGSPDMPPAKPVTLTVGKGTATSFAVAPLVLKAVVAVEENGATRLLLCDLAKGAVAVEWEFPEAFEVVGISPAGTRFLLLRRDPGPRDVLHLWTADGQDLTRRNWTPHDSTAPDVPGGLATATSDAARRERQVRWAAFAGNDRVVSASVGGQLRVWNAGNLERTGTIEASPAAPCLSPDGTRVAFLTPQGVALLDPAAAKVLGLKAGPFPTGDLAINPAATTLAVAGQDRVVQLNLVSGEVTDQKGAAKWDREAWVVTPAANGKATLRPTALKGDGPPAK
jgi:hypothetical protein